VSHWFEERRALAIALVLVGFNLGYISAGPLAAWLIDHLGWRGAYGILGGGCGVLTMAAALTVRLPRPGEAPARRPAAAGAPASDMTLRQALADPRQWYLSASWFLTGALALMISVHIVPFARDHGVGLAAASLGLTAYGVGSATGRVGSGVVSEHLGSLRTIQIGFLVQIIALLGIWWSPSQGVLLAALVAFGVGFAAADTMFTKVIPDVFGMRAIGAIMGVLALGWRVGAALGPATAGFVYDATGSYAAPFGAAPLAVVVSWVFFALGTARRA
jgi:MFS transporter, OFA family, oxalate/formate antiporter